MKNGRMHTQCTEISWAHWGINTWCTIWGTMSAVLITAVTKTTSYLDMTRLSFSMESSGRLLYASRKSGPRASRSRSSRITPCIQVTHSIIARRMQSNLPPMMQDLTRTSHFIFLLPLTTAINSQQMNYHNWRVWSGSHDPLQKFGTILYFSKR